MKADNRIFYGAAFLGWFVLTPLAIMARPSPEHRGALSNHVVSTSGGVGLGTFILTRVGTQANPEFQLNRGASVSIGWSEYEGDDILNLTFGGVSDFRFNRDLIRGVVANDPAFINDAAGGTDAVFTFFGDDDTGWGRADADELSLIAGEVPAVIIREGSEQAGEVQLNYAEGPCEFADLGTPANGTECYCDNCTFANPCTGGGNGAFAKRINGAWRCD